MAPGSGRPGYRSGELMQTRVALAAAALAALIASGTAQGPYFTLEQVPGRPGHDGRVIDLGADGAPDVVVTDLAWPPAATGLRGLRNDGAGHFTESGDAMGLAGVTTEHARHFAVGDFNGDGRQDMVIADHGLDEAPFAGGQSRLLIQDAAGRLADETASRLPLVRAFTHHVSAGDIDGDGDLDLYLCNIYGAGQVGPRFYVNDGSGHFAADATRIPSELATLQVKYESSALVDLDGDGDLDLVLGGHELTGNTRDAILVNDGTGHFAFAPVGIMPPRAGDGNWGTVAMATADFDHDGNPDLLMATHDNYRQPRLQLLLRAPALFVDASANIPQAWPAPDGQPHWITWVLTADFNGDGWMDLVTTGGGDVPVHLYLNAGAGVFEDHSEILPARPVATAVLPADIDRDGDMDLVGIGGAGPYWVMRNERPFVLSGQPCSTPAPTNLAYTRSGSQVTLTWRGTIPLPESYVLAAGSRPGSRDLLTQDLGPGTSFAATAPSGTYYVDVRARYRCGTSLPTNELVVVVP